MTPLWLWHGWGMHPEAWHNLAGHLPVALQMPALPGYAGTLAPTPYTQDALVDALLADVDQPIALCGWSLGALLALHAAHRHPGKVSRLVLIGATPSFVQRVGWPHGMSPDALAEFTQTVAADPAHALKRFIALFNQGDVNSRATSRELNHALGRDALPAVSTLLAGLDLLRDTDLRLQVPQVQQPTLLLHGALDPLMPLAAAHWLADTLPHARLAVLPDAAHAPFVSDADADACAALITAFMP